jgi:diguanylate cyclase (GGDEF)-like protein
LGFIQDITERSRMEEQVRQLAFIDPLTQLPNRRVLDDRLDQALIASKRSGVHGALVFVDLDNFKPLNDAHGHGAGDLLLIEAASRLKRCVREMDTVSRFGGDEFVVLLRELAVDEVDAKEEARMVAEKICIWLARPYLLTVKREGAPDTSVEHRCTASIGAVIFGDRDATHSDIIRWADSAMYRAKAAGRNAVRFHEATINC